MDKIIIGIQTIGHQNYSILYEIIVITALWLSYTVIEIKSNLQLDDYTKTMVFLTLIIHILVGQYLDFYNKFSVFDILLHILGTYAFTLFTYLLLNQIINKPILSQTYKFIFIILLGISLGTSFELIEFLIDLGFNLNPPMQNGLIDTNLDLVADIIGGLIAACHLTITNFIKKG
ncbi:hypothetical protein [Halanaerobaculum tunisiense]